MTRGPAASGPSARLARQVFFAKLQEVAKRKDVAGWESKAERLLASCHPWQRNLVLDPARRVVVLTSGRGGKTTGFRVRALRKMMRKAGARVLFIASSKPAAEELMWSPLKKTLGQLGIRPGDGVKYQESALRCTLKNGSTYRLVGANDTKEVDKIRGQPFDEVQIDEAQSHNPELLQYLIEQAVGPRLGDYKGSLVLGGTPGRFPRGLFWELTKKTTTKARLWEERASFPSWRGWSGHWWNMQMAAPYAKNIQSAWEEALETKAREGWSDQHPTWLREYMGVWALDDTQAVFRYDPEINQWDPERDELGIAVLPPALGEWHHSFAIDLGGGISSGAAVRDTERERLAAVRESTGQKESMGDPMAMGVLSWDDADPEKRLIHTFEFHTRERMYSRRIAQLLLGEELDASRPAGVFGRLGWPDALAADCGSLGGLILEELANVYGIVIEPAEKKNRPDAIEGTNGDLIDGRLKIMKGSLLEQQMQELQWDYDRFGMRAKNKRQRDDAADYGVYARSNANHLMSEARPESERERASAPAPLPAAPDEPPRLRRVNFDEFAEMSYYDDEEAWG